jgi:hypothetical protein
LNRIESSAFSFSLLQSIEIPRNVEILGSSSFSDCSSLSSISSISFESFESNSRLNRIESSAFQSSSIRSIEIPRNVEILGSPCFSFCQSLSSILFESMARLNRIESEAFSSSSLDQLKFHEMFKSMINAKLICLTGLNHLPSKRPQMQTTAQKQWNVNVRHAIVPGNSPTGE